VSTVWDKFECGFDHLCNLASLEGFRIDAGHLNKRTNGIEDERITRIEHRIVRGVRFGKWLMKFFIR